MWRRTSRPIPGGTRAFVYALLVHITLLLLLGISLRFSTRPSEPPRVVQARVVDETPKLAPEPPDTARLQEQARRQAEAERTRQAEVKKRQEAERRQQKEAERKKQAAETEKAEKKKAAALEKKRTEEKRRKEDEAALKSQVTAEEKQRADAGRLRKEQSEIDRYYGLIKQQVTRNWNIPAASRKGLKCTLRVRVVSGGEVLAVNVIVSSGDPVFDRSAENALFKASPLQVPSDPDLFNRVFREFNFDFDPEKK